MARPMVKPNHSAATDEEVTKQIGPLTRVQMSDEEDEDEDEEDRFTSLSPLSTQLTPRVTEKVILGPFGPSRGSLCPLILSSLSPDGRRAT